MNDWIGRHVGRTIGAVALGLLLVSAIPTSGALAQPDIEADQEIAQSLSAMLQAARGVISRHQGDINDPNRADKGLTADVVLTETVASYLAATGEDPRSLDPASREGRLIAAQMDAIAEVMDTNQSLINTQGLGFKGFIPAVFARLINEAFERRVGDEAVVKVTAPPELVRNRRSRPDTWEAEVIATRLRDPAWKRGTPFATMTNQDGRPAFRMMVPEYYGASCLSCHGNPKGSMDITGYPREGAAEGDLGGVISITLLP
ncbi:Tll0287-like domain-containing protein [Marinivivus vitaminiproducens]|uniref:Tll0287-like domain-containing protein n=1 Tax=Marinivivus vitaminiproducens TaxID=3035935 RepID=UPI00279A0247|nr:DUF3365 domain-containing protein [Geminicoccaceae bacterium SCSIO 64248]